MQPVPPFWFHQRQAKLDPAGAEDSYRITAPNAAEGFIGIQKTNGDWRPVFRLSAAGPDLAEAAAKCRTPKEAWDAAFELYRVHVLV